MNITVGLTEIASKIGSLDTAFDTVVRIAAPKSFTKTDLTKLRRDCELFLERIEKNPEQIQAVVNLGLSGKLQAANDIVNKLKLREEDFEKEGGGFIIILILIVILICASASEAR